jgi:hypothetical protein
MRNNNGKIMKNCFKCDVEIIGPMAYCKPCHTKILEILRGKRGKKSVKPNIPS